MLGLPSSEGKDVNARLSPKFSVYLFHPPSFLFLFDFIGLLLIYFIVLLSPGDISVAEKNPDAVLKTLVKTYAKVFFFSFLGLIPQLNSIGFLLFPYRKTRSVTKSWHADVKLSA